MVQAVENPNVQRPAASSSQAQALEAINSGDNARAITLLQEQVDSGKALPMDYALLAHAYREAGRPRDAAKYYKEAAARGEAHPLAAQWLQWAGQAESAARAGRGISDTNPTGISSAKTATDPKDVAKNGPRVLPDTDWILPNGYIPKTSLTQAVRNKGAAVMTDALLKGGNLIGKIPERPNSAGGWTERKTKQGQLATLSDDREKLWETSQPPPGSTPEWAKDENRERPHYAYTGFTADGADNNAKRPEVGRVGTPRSYHGFDGVPKDRSKDPTLPDVAVVAEEFGYRKGQIIEAATASAHAWGHLQLLVHDVAQTAHAGGRRHAMPTHANSALAQMGIKNTHGRSDARNAEGHTMNAVTGAWDMSPIYGSSAEQIAKVRTDPNTGEFVPRGKLYLVDGFLPTEGEGDSERIITGFRPNMTAPLEAEHTLYARHHNWVAEQLAERHPEWSDNQIFQIARRVVAMTYVKIHTAPWTDALFAHPAVVEGLHSNIFGRRDAKGKTVGEQRIYDPVGGNHPVADGLAGRSEPYRDEIPENKGHGFDVAYRFGHAIVPDTHYFPEIGDKTDKATTMAVNTREMREMSGHRLLRELGLGRVFYGLMHTRLGAPVDGNYAELFRRMDTEGGVVDLMEQELTKDRQRGIFYNDYLKAHNLPPIKSFEDLFKEPNSPEAQAKIERLNELYKSVDDFDVSLGLLMNEFRPDGFAITNPAFQTFVLEATNRIAKQENFTTRWNPTHVGWTAINIVEAMDKEKLLYLHAPELREYLASRPNPNTYEYMGTSYATHPKEHPLQDGILDYGDDFVSEINLEDVGLGWPWKKEHFTGEGLENHYLVRVQHRETNQQFIVDINEGTVRSDVNKDGRVEARELLHEEPEGVTRAEIVAAAQGFKSQAETLAKQAGSEENDVWPGLVSDDGQFVSNTRLSADEVKTLKQWKADEDREGVEAWKRAK